MRAILSTDWNSLLVLSSYASVYYFRSCLHSLYFSNPQAPTLVGGILIKAALQHLFPFPLRPLRKMLPSDLGNDYRLSKFQRLMILKAWHKRFLMALTEAMISGAGVKAVIVRSFLRVSIAFQISGAVWQLICSRHRSQDRRVRLPIL